MATVETKFTDYSVKTGQGQYGPWALTIFEAQNGQKYQTFDEEIASMGVDAVDSGFTAHVEFEVESRGKYTNNVISNLRLQYDHPNAPVASRKAPEAVQTPEPRQSSSEVDRSAQIHRQTASKVAVNIFAIENESVLQNFDAYLELCEQLTVFYASGRAAVGVAEEPVV